ncbi:MAG: sugar phosphate isomerase/epimerase [Methanocalculus sp. MSAO_Arc1]|uniref:sugar phosphate isomerase/epimerase family protein n=1 Tax=Methanocalculus TaxID=71151 RepID=UPI000FF5C00C|nr:MULTISPECIES: sugar phosphate isomerase/epimerase family protein [unclassified Methanocalculus]MCP1661817.1 sugar phosphate isomerase/epimerase [Methanocalculus sp. AMF5]RQD80207.1 MAG: sugar phosphate isomerase/epimerase [Methanocalculus sp. MSAO_Arc1]
MIQALYFSSSSKVWDDPDWVFGIEEIGYDGWEISADGNYRLDEKSKKERLSDVIASTSLQVTVHAPYGDLNPASINYPIWRESVRQVCLCIEHAADLTDRVTIHPGYLSPLSKYDPGRAWSLQKEALTEIGKTAEDHGILACLENMISIKEFLCRDPGELFGMIEGIEGIGTTIDIGHANTTGTVDEFLRHLGSADHLHLHDNHGSSDEHLALRRGTVDWNRVSKAVLESYSGIVVVEGRNLVEAEESLHVVRGWH